LLLSFLLIDTILLHNERSGDYSAGGIGGAVSVVSLMSTGSKFCINEGRGIVAE